MTLQIGHIGLAVPLVLKVDEQYTDWIVKIPRQLKLDKCFQIIKTSFEANQV